MVEATSETACHNNEYILFFPETVKRELRIRFVFFGGELDEINIERAYPLQRVGADAVAVADKKRRRQVCGAAYICAVVDAIYNAIGGCILKP